MSCRYLRTFGNSFPIVEQPKVTIDSGQVKISDVKIDFSGYGISDLPTKYQEVSIYQIWDGIPRIELIGYVEKYVLPKFTTGNEAKIITIKLLTPQVVAGKRTITYRFSTESLLTVLENICSPLTNEDGFTIDLSDISDLEVRFSDTYIKQPIEKLLNDLAKRFSFMWYITALKEIRFKSLSNIQEAAVDHTVNTIDCKYLQSMTPFIVSADYANIINIKNIKLVQSETYIDLTTDPPFTIKAGESYSFKNAYWNSEVGFWKSVPTALTEADYFVFQFSSTTTSYEWYIKYYGPDYSDPALADTLEFSPNLGIDGDDNEDTTKTAWLIRDSFVSNVYTGIKFRDDVEADACTATMSLVPFSFTFFDIEEIEASAPKTNTSGKVEKTINANNKYLGRKDVFEYARGNLVEANNEVGEVDLTFQNEEDSDYHEFINSWKLGDKVEIVLPDLYVDGFYIVTSLEYQYKRGLTILKVGTKNLTLNETFLDIYRKEEGQEDEDQLAINGIGVYFKDESIIERHTILVNGVAVDYENN